MKPKHQVPVATITSFTFDGFEGLCPMHASGDINGRRWTYRLEREPWRETLAIDGESIASHEFPADVFAGGASAFPAFAGEQIEFIVLRLLRWGSAQREGAPQ